MAGHKRKQPENKHKSGKPGSSGGEFNPFTSMPASALAATPANKSWRPWIAGSTSASRNELTAKKLCWLCKGTSHTLVTCPKAQGLFKDKKFCWYLPA